jgi:membrane dipeptidase
MEPVTSSTLVAHAAKLHGESIVIDAHSDILQAVNDGQVRLGERTIVEGVTTRSVVGHYDLPRWIEGGVTAQVCALYVRDESLHVALSYALDMVAAAYEEIAVNERLMLATNVVDIARAKESGKVALVLSMEGVDPLGGNLKYLRLFYQLGVRMASLTHARRNYFSGGVGRGIDESAGLTPLGVRAVQLMNELGMVVDLRHLDARAIQQILEMTSAPVVFSHVNAREAFPRDPNDTPHYPFSLAPGIDRHGMLKAIGAKGGMVCIIFWRQKNIDAIVDDMEYVASEIGVEHVGLGTDFYGFDMVPEDAEDVSKFPRVTERLLQRGFKDDDIKGILGGNVMRLFGRVWK